VNHELMKLIHWEAFDDQWGALFKPDRGASAMPTHLIAGLHYLKSYRTMKWLIAGWRTRIDCTSAERSGFVMIRRLIRIP